MPIKVNKPLGFTPLEIVKKYKTENNIKEKVSFAGRLDPMAYGMMILLVGDECKQQNLYCGKDKIYEFNIIYGFKSDSLDILGISEKIDEIKLNFKEIVGKYLQSYPIYSSKTLTLDGKTKPLWWWHKNNKLEKTLIPKKEVEIYKLEKLDDIKMSNIEAKNMIIGKISTLSEKSKSQLRFNEIKKNWESILEEKSELKIAKFRIYVSSGTYIRKICERMGGIAYDINRINIIF